MFVPFFFLCSFCPSPSLPFLLSPRATWPSFLSLVTGLDTLLHGHYKGQSPVTMPSTVCKTMEIGRAFSTFSQMGTLNYCTVERLGPRTPVLSKQMWGCLHVGMPHYWSASSISPAVPSFCTQDNGLFSRRTQPPQTKLLSANFEARALTVLHSFHLMSFHSVSSTHHLLTLSCASVRL